MTRLVVGSLDKLCKSCPGGLTNRKHTITTRKKISQAMKRWWQKRKKETGEKSE